MNNLSSKNTNQQLLQFIEEFLDDATTAMVEDRCVHCGSVMHPVPTTFCVWGTDRTWDIPLFVCTVCNPEESGRDHEANNTARPI